MHKSLNFFFKLSIKHVIKHASSFWIQQLFWFFCWKIQLFSFTSSSNHEIRKYYFDDLFLFLMFRLNETMKKNNSLKISSITNCFITFCFFDDDFCKFESFFRFLNCVFFITTFEFEKFEKFVSISSAFNAINWKKKIFFRQKLHRVIEKTRRVFKINEILNEFFDRNFFRVFWSSNILKKNCKKRLCKKRRIVFNTFWKIKFKIVIYDWVQLQFWKTFFNFLKVDCHVFMTWWLIIK